MPPVHGLDPDTGAEISRKPSDEEPFSALAFKLQNDPFVGQLTFFRVYSGTIEAGTYIYNSTTGEKERLGRIVRLQADKREEVKKVFAGEIAAAVGLKSAKTSHTLCDESEPIILDPIKFVAPVVSLRIEPKTKAESRLEAIADIAPRAAILESWLLVEAAAADVIQKQNLGNLNAYPGPLRLREILQKGNILNSRQLAVFEQLRKLRNDAVHVPDAQFTKEAALSYIQPALAMSAFLEKLTNDS